MGWFLRKSVRMGPVRLNFSKSGIGVSAGVKGLRVSHGPRGTHLFAGRHGLYFRERLDAPRARPGTRAPSASRAQNREPELTEIESADAGQLVGPDSEAFIRALVERRQRTAYFPIVVVIGVAGIVVSTALAMNGSMWWWVAVVCILSGASTGGWFVRERDLERKTVEVEYLMDEREAKFWSELELALISVASCRRMWQRTAQGSVHDRKYHAGASTLIRRRLIRIRRGMPPYFKSNIAFFKMDLHRQTLYWTPRYILVYEGLDVGLVRYADLHISTHTTRFIENEAVPTDAEVVDTTWRYVNKSGGPDRRFANNPQIPVCEYGEASLRSQGGLHAELMFSRVGAGDRIRPALDAIVAHRVEKEKELAALPSPQQAAIVFHCHSCGKRFRVHVDLAGKTAKCRACSAPLIIPKLSQAELA